MSELVLSSGQFSQAEAQPGAGAHETGDGVRTVTIRGLSS